MNYSFELNNERNDATLINKNFSAKSPVVEVFSAMISGKDIKFDAKTANKCTRYIQELNSKASAGDVVAISELNQMRRFVMEPALMKELKLLGVLGNYSNIGYNESCEVEVPTYVGKGGRIQAPGQDTPIATLRKVRTPIATTTISAGYAVDYRKAALGDMSDESELQEQIKVDLRNKAIRYVVESIYAALKNCDGIKYFFEGSGLTKTGVDGVLQNIRRFGKPTVAADYALLAQFNAFAGYQGTTPSVTGISEAIMNEIHNNGIMGIYNGAILSEIPNEFDTSTLNAKGDNFETIIPAGIGLVLPSGKKSPIYTISRGGITTISGNDVASGQTVSRFDLEIGTVVAKGREHEVGVISDKNLSTIA